MPETLPTPLPGVGQAFDLAIPEDAAAGLQAATALSYEVRAFQEDCRQALRAESDRQGARTFRVGEFKVEVATEENATLVQYDVQQLWDGLAAAGLPVERLAELVTYEPKVSGTVLRQIVKNPVYQKVVEDAVESRTLKSRGVKVS